MGESYQTFKELASTLHSSRKKKEAEETLPNSFYEATIAMKTKSDKNSTKKHNYTLIYLMNIENSKKILNKILAS